MHRRKTSTEEKVRAWAKVFANFSLIGFGLGFTILLASLVVAIGKTAGAFAGFMTAMFLTGLGAAFFWWVAENADKIVHRFKKLGGNN